MGWIDLDLVRFVVLGLDLDFALTGLDLALTGLDLVLAGLDLGLAECLSKTFFHLLCLAQFDQHVYLFSHQ